MLPMSNVKATMANMTVYLLIVTSTCGTGGVASLLSGVVITAVRSKEIKTFL